MKPIKDSYPSYYQYFIDLSSNENVIAALESAHLKFITFVSNLPLEKADYSYAPDKWTIKQVLQHINDTERILACRALCFSRGDNTILPGFNENEYAINDNSSNTLVSQITDEGIVIQQATIHLFKKLNPLLLDNLGNANGTKVSINALGYMIAGHLLHHIKIINERYL
jgi:hypothetical protein